MADPQVNPAVPVDLIVDHAVMADEHGTKDAVLKNLSLEIERNAERYAFLRWAAQAFDNVRIVPPGNGILHQVNLEHIAQVVRVGDGARLRATADRRKPAQHLSSWRDLGKEGARMLLRQKDVALQRSDVLGEIVAAGGDVDDGRPCYRHSTAQAAFWLPFMRPAACSMALREMPR